MFHSMDLLVIDTLDLISKGLMKCKYSLNIKLFRKKVAS